MKDTTKKIGLIGAMDEEVAILKSSMEQPKEMTKADMTFVHGSLWGTETVVVVSGIGKVNMAVCTQILIDTYGVDTLINTGVAGSLNNALDIGDIVLSCCAQQHDMDVSPLGDPVGVIPRMDTSVFLADEELQRMALSACERANPDIHCHIGKVVSGDQFIADAAKKEYLVNTFQGDCAEMEGASMAHVAHLNHIPFLIIRAISDKADQSGHMDYPTFAKQAITHTVNLLRELYTMF
jgi:adenosylhomocysteine nucleosidase